MFFNFKIQRINNLGLKIGHASMVILNLCVVRCWFQTEFIRAWCGEHIIFILSLLHMYSGDYLPCVVCRSDFVMTVQVQRRRRLNRNWSNVLIKKYDPSSNCPPPLVYVEMITWALTCPTCIVLEFCFSITYFS